MASNGIGGNEFEQFQATFFQECAELMADMEGRLTAMAAGPVDREALDAIFRAVHSIKAGAGAFGFSRLVTYTHTFEALLDKLRDGLIPQSERLVHLLVRGADVLAALIEAAQRGTTVSDEYGADSLAEMAEYLGEGQKGAGAAAPKSAPSAALSAESEKLFHITFKPHSELFRHANEPLLLLRELKRLGTLEVVCDLARLPALATMDPENAYLGWSLHLTTRHSREDILEIFEFVDEDCDLVVTTEATTQPSAPDPTAETGAGSANSTTVSEVSEQPRRASSSSVDTQPVIASAPGKSNAAASIRVDLTRIDRLVNMVGELVITQAMLAQQIEDNRIGAGQAIRGHEDLAVLTRELQECVMAIRMQPVKSVFARMPRLVRELSAKLGKDIRLITSGEQTEVDKTVIEELADPLTHMIRNSIDHGIEDAATRLSRGKAEFGTIELSASHVGSNIVIHVADDGAGFNRERMLKKAIDKGLVAPGAKLTDDEIDELVFAPGFSTAAAVTDVSGRGVGMDVVRRNITNLGGRVHVQSLEGRGTRFTMTIPLTLAVLDGMVVAVGREKYILPLTSIIESFRPEARSVRNLHGGRQVVSIRGEYIPLVYLYRIFDVPGAISEPHNGLVVVIETTAGNKIGLVVDELIGQQQVVIKSLSENFDPVPGISGATILGNGRVALIVDLEHLVMMTERAVGTPLRHPDGAPSLPPPPPPNPA